MHPSIHMTLLCDADVMFRTALSTLGGIQRATTDVAADASTSTSGAVAGKADRTKMVSVETSMARMLRDRPLGSTRVTCSVRGLEGIKRAHERVIAGCDVVARDLPRIARCVDDDEDEDDDEDDEVAGGVLKENRRTMTTKNDDDARRRRTTSKNTTAKSTSLSLSIPSSEMSSDIGEDEVPLYARRKWKAPLRLDVRAGASLGNIETVVE